ncbi:MAG: hypothetical protein V1708_02440 [Candidatus Micrarchaeota archaeon]
MIEDEIAHWFKDDAGQSHKSTLRLETDAPSLANGYPKDGIITLRVINGVGTIGFRLSPDEALRIATHLLQLAKEQMQKKRRLWNERDEAYQKGGRNEKQAQTA